MGRLIVIASISKFNWFKLETWQWRRSAGLVINGTRTEMQHFPLSEWRIYDKFIMQLRINWLSVMEGNCRPSFIVVVTKRSPPSTQRLQGRWSEMQNPFVIQSLGDISGVVIEFLKRSSSLGVEWHCEEGNRKYSLQQFRTQFIVIRKCFSIKVCQVSVQWVGRVISRDYLGSQVAKEKASKYSESGKVSFNWIETPQFAELQRLWMAWGLITSAGQQ